MALALTLERTVLNNVDDFGPDYARTLRIWRDNFLARLDQVRALGFDDRFIRKWTYYLGYCEAAFAMLCGAAPLPASSGRTHRHRLNRGGDRQANAALYRVVLCRLRWDPRTRAYAQRRTTEGMSKPEIIRCLKRYIAREIYTALLNPQPSSAPAITSTAPQESTWSARSAARTNDVDTDKR